MENERWTTLVGQWHNGQEISCTWLNPTLRYADKTFQVSRHGRGSSRRRGWGSPPCKHQRSHRSRPFQRDIMQDMQSQAPRGLQIPDVVTLEIEGIMVRTPEDMSTMPDFFSQYAKSSTIVVIATTRAQVDHQGLASTTSFFYFLFLLEISASQDRF
jgi:hypothetical protein